MHDLTEIVIFTMGNVINKEGRSSSEEEKEEEEEEEEEISSSSEEEEAIEGYFFCQVMGSTLKHYTGSPISSCPSSSDEHEEIDADFLTLITCKYFLFVSFLF